LLLDGRLAREAGTAHRGPRGEVELPEAEVAPTRGRRASVPGRLAHDDGVGRVGVVREGSADGFVEGFVLDDEGGGSRDWGGGCRRSGGGGGGSCGGLGVGRGLGGGWCFDRELERHPAYDLRPRKPRGSQQCRIDLVLRERV